MQNIQGKHTVQAKMFRTLQLRDENEVDLQKKCEELQKQLDLKEKLINELRSYNQVLIAKLNMENINQVQLSEQIDQLRSELRERDDNFGRLLRMEVEREKATSLQRIPKASMTLSTQQRQESKLVRSIIQLVKGCHPEYYFDEGEPTYKQCWVWLNNVLTEYIKLKMK